MFKSFDNLFKKVLEPGAETQDETHRLRVATCVLLLEVAHADEEFSPDERQTVRDLIARRFDLDDTETHELLAAADRERRESTDLYQFARLINERFSRPRKLALLELLWQVVFSDGVLAAHEDALMHRLSHLLGIRRQDLIALKQRVKQNPR
jgi:uncharacterized tellurite resistance protein B-like protein